MHPPHPASNLIKFNKKIFFWYLWSEVLNPCEKNKIWKKWKGKSWKNDYCTNLFFFSFIINFGFCRNFIFLYKKMFEDFYNYLLFLFVPLSNKKMRRREISFSSFYFLLLVHISIIVNIFMNTFQYLIFERRARCRNLQMLL